MKSIFIIFLIFGLVWCVTVQSDTTTLAYESDTVLFYDNPFSTQDSLSTLIKTIEEIQPFLPVYTLISYQNDLYTVKIPFGPAMHDVLIHDDIYELFEFIRLAKWELLDF